MLKIIGNIPHEVHLACSGGADSMAVLDFLRKGKKKVTAVYFNHGTEHSEHVHKGLLAYCEAQGIDFIAGTIQQPKKAEESWEEYWRNERYAFFDTLNTDIITAHNLDDVVETYLFSAFHGKPKLINYKRGHVYRPFLLTKKVDLENWCKDKGVPFWEDKSNTDTKYARNRIRHNIVPEVLKINPGIHKTITKMIKESIAP